MQLSGILIAGISAGAINGLFGAGGGMVLVPMLVKFAKLQENEVFPSSVCIILPVCLISLFFSYQPNLLDPKTIAVYLLGSAAGGVLTGLFGKKIPTLWLHRALGILVIWGGIRYLC